MKRRKVGPIGIVVGDDVLRAAQRTERELVHASVPRGDSLKKELRQLLSSSPFVGRDVVLGLEGGAVLVESFALTPSAAKDVRKTCQDRLKGDPIFNADKAQIGFAVATLAAESGKQVAPVAIMAALDHQRVSDLVKACREAELNVLAVEAASLAAWRAWEGHALHGRMIVSGTRAVVLAGRDQDLQFCRIVEAPVQPDELKATLVYASALLGVDTLGSLEVVGLDPDLRAVLADTAGVEFKDPPRPMKDATAAGLATTGRIQADFLPPEERVLREKRRVRRVGVVMAACLGMLVLAVGMLGTQKLTVLKDAQDRLRQQRDIVRADKVALDKVKADLAREQANEFTIADARPGHRMSTLFTLVSAAASKAISFETMKITDVVDPSVKSSSTAGANAGGSPGPVKRILEIRMNGLARTGPAVRQFTDALLETGAFKDVRVEASERVLLGVGIEGERFRIYAKAETH